jgi:hypothetical protein
MGRETEMDSRIVAAAILLDDQIWTLPAPARHHHILQAIESVHPDKALEAHPETQGFIDGAGNFVGRVVAARLAVAFGQIAPTKVGSQLFSEDLW